MDKKTLHEILLTFGLKAKQLMPMQTGYRNHNYPVQLHNDEIVNLIIYKQEPGIVETIKNANDVSNYLAKTGLPARQSIDPRILRLKGQTIERFAGLYNYLPGHTIPWEAYTHKHLKLLGSNLGQMHTALGAFVPSKTRAFHAVTERNITILEQMQTYFSKPEHLQAVERKLHITVRLGLFENFEKLLAGCSHLPDQQVLHLDFVRGNILFQSDPELELCGILDFEKVSIGHPFFDIARTLAFLMVDCKYKPIKEVRKSFLQSGYIKAGSRRLQPIRIKLAHSEHDVLESLINFYLVYDFYKFLRHNPYENLEENEHFIRTKILLLERNLLRLTH